MNIPVISFTKAFSRLRSHYLRARALFIIYLSARFGFHKISLISSFFLFFYFLFLFLLPKHPWLLIPVLASIILRSALFWPGFHLLFATSSTKEKRGNAFGNLTITTAIASVGGPVLGGFIVTHFGYQTLFMFALPLIVISATPLFLLKNAKTFAHEKMSKTLKRLKKKSELQAGIAFATSGAEDEANLRLWPLFLFFIAISYSTMGIIVSLATAFSLIATWYLGKLTDKKNRLKLLGFGSLITSGR